MKLISYSLVFLVIALNALFAQKDPKVPPRQEGSVPEINAEMGDCTADFRVTDTRQQPIYRAKLRTQIKYGFAGFRKLDLEIETNVDGEARLVGLPPKTREPLAVHADYNGRGTVVIVSPIQKCHGSYNAVITDRPVKTDEDNEPDE
jgi:hypothetical protein